MLRRTFIPILMLGHLILLVACGDESSSPTENAKSARYRAGIPDFAAQVCEKYATASSAFGPACLAAAEAHLLAVADRLDQAPPDWEERVITLGSICQREAFRYSQSEADGRSEQDLLVEGLRRAPECLDRQWELLLELARKEGVPLPE